MGLAFLTVLSRLMLVWLVAVLALNVLWLAQAAPSWWMVPAAFVGWYLADFGSGCAHILLDYVPCRAGNGLRELYHFPGRRGGPEYQALRATVMGRVGPFQQLLFDNKIHHPRPGFLGRRALGHLLLPNILLFATPAAVIQLASHQWWRVPGWAVAGGLALLAGSVFSQYTHALVHRPTAKVPWPARTAQALRLFITPAGHAGHHVAFDRDFCLLTGWANPLLNRGFAWVMRRGWLHADGLEPR